MSSWLTLRVFSLFYEHAFLYVEASSVLLKIMVLDFCLVEIITKSFPFCVVSESVLEGTLEREVLPALENWARSYHDGVMERAET